MNRPQSTESLAHHDPQRCGVVLLGELFGVTPHVRGVAETLANAGHAVRVVDFLARLGVTEPLAEDDAGRERGFRLLEQVSLDRVLADVKVATGALGPGPVALLGLSVGAYLGLRLLTDSADELAQIDRAALLYPGWLDTQDNPLRDGVRLGSRWDDLRARCLVLTGGEDALVRSTSASLVAEGAPRANAHVAVTVLPRVGHGFLATHRPAHDPAAAGQAWQEVLSFLR